MTPFEVCEKARRMLAGTVAAPRVRVWFGDGGPITGALKGVSPVNAWIKVDTLKVPAEAVTRIEAIT